MGKVEKDPKNTERKLEAGRLVQETLDRLKAKLDAGKTATCVNCGDVNYLFESFDVRKTMEHSDLPNPPKKDGKDVFLCGECREKLREEYRLDQHFIQTVGPFMARTCSLESFQLRSDKQESAYYAALEFDPTKSGLFLYGNCGVGKSHLAVAVLREHWKKIKGSAAFIKPHWLIRRIRGKTGDEEELLLKELGTKKILVVDDLGLGKATQFMLDLLYDILDFRISAGLRGIIITSNINLDKIRDRFGDDRLSSRIRNLCDGILMEGPDGRFAETKAEEGKPKKSKQTQEEIPF